VPTLVFYHKNNQKATKKCLKPAPYGRGASKICNNDQKSAKIAKKQQKCVFFSRKKRKKACIDAPKRHVFALRARA